VELGAVVGGDGLECMFFWSEELDGALGSVHCGGAWELADPQLTAEAVNDSKDASFARPMHGIDFPVAEPGALLNDRGAFRDHLFARQTAATIIVSVAFAFFLLPVSQVAPQLSTRAPVLDDPLIDGLMTHDFVSFEFGTADDLLRAELSRKEVFDYGKGCFSKA